MQEKLQSGDAIDLSDCKRTPDGDYIVTNFVEGVDYCDTKTESWIWSIGKNLETGQVVASTSTKFYGDPNYKCVWLR